MSSEKPYFIGLMSGTSLDAIDAALVDFSANPPRLVASANTSIPQPLHQQIIALCTPGDNEVQRMGITDGQLGKLFAQAANNLLAQTAIDAAEVCAIGSHGQTIRHEPQAATPYTLQIGDPNIIAQHTGITTVADFRRRDMAAGGQGAPLAPAFHAALFRSSSANRAMLNIGGMANLTLLPATSSKPASGFDTGPGNVLLDSWCQLHQQQSFDKNGAWARSGSTDTGLLQQLLETAYFGKTPPKSTGRELFNHNWLSQQLNTYGKAVAAADVASTLAELTARSIADDLQRYFPACSELFVCGGGAHNAYLLERIAALCPDIQVASTNELGIAPDWVEAIAFAWLAKCTLSRQPANLPVVTGASEKCILGGVYYA